MSKPLPPDQEGFIYAELPMDMLVTVRHFSDPVGHYSRPDLLWLGVDSREKKHVRSEGADRQDVANGVKNTNGVDEGQNGKV